MYEYLYVIYIYIALKNTFWSNDHKIVLFSLLVMFDKSTTVLSIFCTFIQSFIYFVSSLNMFDLGKKINGKKLKNALFM